MKDFVYYFLFFVMAIGLFATMYYGHVAYKSRDYSFVFVFFLIGCEFIMVCLYIFYVLLT